MSAREIPVAASPPARPGMVADLMTAGRETWQYRELLAQLTRRDIKIRYKQAVMGLAWALLMPLLVVVAGLIVRLAISSAGGMGIDRAAAGALMVKGLAWSFFVGAIGFATPSLSGNLTLVTRVYFPREVLPLAAMGAVGFDSLIASTMVLLIVPFLGATVSPALLWVPVLLACLVALTAAACLFLSCANLFFRDVKYIVQVLLMFGIFLTPVLFEPAALGAPWSGIVMFNPLAPLLEGLRLVVFEGHSLLEPLVDATGSTAWSPWFVAYFIAWSFGGLAFAAVMFHRAEFAFAEFV